MKQSVVLVFVLFIGACYLQAQNDSIPQVIAPVVTDGLEELFQREDASGAFELVDQLDALRDYQRKPMQLNKATRAQIEDLGLLSPFQIESFLLYKQQYGALLSIYELQAVPGFDAAAIRKIRPYVAVSKDDLAGATSGEQLSRLQQSLIVRATRDLPLENGFASNAFSKTPYGLFVRYRIVSGTGWRAGFTADQDPGEPFFNGINKYGFDFYSGHLFWEGRRGILRKVAVGDYRVRIGQGLLYQGGGLVMGKGGGATNIRRGGHMLQAYTSPNESAGLRGGAVQLEPQKNWDILIFGSRRQRDANLVVVADTLNEFDNQTLTAGSLLLNGLHRTTNEIADKHTLQHTIGGASVRHRFERGHIAFNGIHHRFDVPLERAVRPANIHAFAGNRLTNLGFDYTYRWRNVFLFGEVSKGDRPTPAIVQGFLAGLSNNIDVSVLYRRLPVDYHAIEAMPFAEGSNGNNENGIYVGLSARINNNWSIQGYADYWTRPWLQFLVAKPSFGREFMIRPTFSIRRKMDVYLMYRYKDNAVNVSSEVSSLPFRDVEQQERQQIRLHAQFQFTKALVLRTRAEWSWFDRASTGVSKGSLIYQDVLIAPLGTRISGNFRVALFQTDDYNSRVYTYENNVAYLYRIPVLFDHGIRGYINLRYKPTRGLTIEGHYGRTQYRYLQSVGSGNNLIEGPSRSEMVLQLRFAFGE
jgi:hypothetical protein